MANVTPTPTIRAPLRLEIAKEYDPNIIRFLVAGRRELPVKFAENRKTLFINPDLYTNGLPTPVREIHNVCRLNMQTGQTRRVSFKLLSMLRQHSTDLCRQLTTRMQASLGVDPTYPGS
jgi:hypothetical protein